MTVKPAVKKNATKTNQTINWKDILILENFISQQVQKRNRVNFYNKNNLQTG